MKLHIKISLAIEIKATRRKMKKSIVLIFILNFLNAINISDSKIVNCTYIDNHTSSVQLICKRNFYGFYDDDSYDEFEGASDEDSTMEKSCFYDLFKSDSKVKNQLNVVLLKTSDDCDSSGFGRSSQVFENIRKLEFSFDSKPYASLGLIQSFKHLIQLNISHNNMRMLNLQNFDNVPNLNEVDFSYNQIEVIFGAINANTKLSVANFSHNHLTTFNANNFAGMTKLKVLDLSYNRLFFIHPDAFQSNMNLEMLLLHNNPLMIFDCHIFLPMKSLTSTVLFDKIQKLELNCEGSTMSMPSDNTNEIVIRLPQVKNEFRYNKDYLKNLSYVCLAGSGMKNISKIIELLPSSLEMLLLTSINVKGLDLNVLGRFSSLEQLRIIHSNLSDLEPKIFSHQTELKVLVLYKDNLRIPNATALFAPLKHLQALIISTAHLENIPEILQALPPFIVQLDLSFNYVGKLDVTTFQRFTHLQHLNLSHTNLSNFGFNTFYHQTKLRTLDLSYNNLMKVDFTLFVQGFRELTELYLEGNRLMQIDTLVPSIFPKLSTLAISKNKLSCHSLVEFFHQWKALRFIGNPSNQTHINGIDCNVDVDPTPSEETSKSNDIHTLTPPKHQIIVTHTESHVTKYSVLFLCVMCFGYLVVKSKLIPRIKVKLAHKKIVSNATGRRATSTLALVQQENL